MSPDNKPSLCADPPKDTPNRPASSVEDMLGTVFIVMVCLPGFFFARDPHPNAAALAFRVGLIVVGLIGFIVLQIRKRK
jgi:hypothetical protein